MRNHPNIGLGDTVRLREKVFTCDREPERELFLTEAVKEEPGERAYFSSYDWPLVHTSQIFVKWTNE